MRILVLGLAIMMVWLLSGCGGGGGAASTSSALAGAWLDVAPTGASIAPTERGLAWPSRLLTMETNGNYLFEETNTTSWVRGAYQLTDTTVRFARHGKGGSPIFFSDDPVGYAMFDKYLAITEQSDHVSLALQLSRCVTQYPAHLNTEWLLVRQLTAEGEDLPCTTAVRMSIANGAVVTLTTYDTLQQQLQSTLGTMLTTASGHVGLRVNRGSGSGDNLLLLGSCAVDTNGSMRMIGPSGTRCFFVARQSPSTALIGAWEWRTDTATATLMLNADGTYREEQADTIETGTWKTYANGHLALTTPKRLRVCGWQWKQITTQQFLTIREWTTDSSGLPILQETLWTATI